jgi:hypothetical protein
VKRWKLIDDWRHQLNRLWSIRLALLAVLLGVLEQVLPLFTFIVPERVFAWLSLAVALAAGFARLIKQEKP